MTKPTPDERDAVREISGVPPPLVEIALILTPVLTIMWLTPLIVPDKAARDEVDEVLSLATFLIAVGLNWHRREGLAEIGLRLDNFLDAGRGLLWFTLAGGLMMLAIGWASDSLSLGQRFANHLTILPFWGLLQHYGIQSVINRRWQKILGRGPSSVWLTAATFSALHLPNPTLAVTTLIAGRVWSSVFQRHPNLLAIGLSHGLLSALLANSFPAILLPNMKVGWGYWRGL